MQRKFEVIHDGSETPGEVAHENRAALNSHHVMCLNVLGEAGCGKTALLESLLPILGNSLRVAVLTTDVAGTLDAQRVARLDFPVTQLVTDGACHLTALLVRQAIDRLPLADLDLLIIENLGNSICSAHFDLGEHARISLLSVTQGDDAPAKYPSLFQNTDLVVLTKCDLLPHTDFDMPTAADHIHRLNPTVEIIPTNVKTQAGIYQTAEWITAWQAHASALLGAAERNIPWSPNVAIC